MQATWSCCLAEDGHSCRFRNFRALRDGPPVVFKSIGELSPKVRFRAFRFSMAALSSIRVLLTQSIDVSSAVSRELAYQAMLIEPAMTAPMMSSTYSHEI